MRARVKVREGEGEGEGSGQVPRLVTAHLLRTCLLLTDVLTQGACLLLVLHELAQIHLHVVGGDAVRPPAVRRLLVEVRRVQQRLGRDAAHVQARAAQPAARLDARDTQAELPRLDGGGISARPAPDDDHVVRLRRRREEPAAGPEDGTTAESAQHPVRRDGRCDAVFDGWGR
eukprot:scaffold101683_cov63-Phaeocystis_antarctica.AAC.1